MKIDKRSMKSKLSKWCLVVYCSESVTSVVLKNHRLKSIPKMVFGSSRIREARIYSRPPQVIVP
jgi:hypothetical protein